MERVYDFAIVRVCPDPRRGELVNIGIVVFGTGLLDVRILPSLAKVRALHGDLDLTELHDLPTRMRDVVKGQRSAAKKYAILKDVGMVTLSEMGRFRAHDEQGYARVVEQLLVRLVKPTAGVVERPSSSKLFSQVKGVIRAAKILGKNQGDFENHKLITNYPMSVNKGLYADFAGRNSVSYFMETIDFRVGKGIHGPKFNESAKAAFVLREAMGQSQDSKRFVLYAATAETERQVNTHLNLLGEFATDFVNFESGQDRARCIGQLAVAFNGELPLN